MAALVRTAVVSCCLAAALVPATAQAKQSPWKVTAGVSPSSITVGETAHVTGSVKPKTSGRKVALEQKAGAKWKRVWQKALTSKSKFDISFAPPAEGAYKLRVTIAAGGGHKAGASSQISLTVKTASGTGPSQSGPPAGEKPKEEPPKEEPQGPGNVKELALGNTHTCALLDTGSVKCWGSNSSGELGSGASFENTFEPQSVSGITTAVEVDAEGWSSCARLQGGSEQCWGDNEDAKLGTGSATGPETCGGPCSRVPMTVAGLGEAPTEIAVGFFHNCALISAAVKCWGNQVGLTPTAVSGMTNVASVSSGPYVTCAVLETGKVRCAGDNEYAQLGKGTTGGGVAQTESVEVTGITGASASTKAVEVAVGGRHVCARMESGAVMCWGSDERGQLGDNRATTTECQIGISTKFKCAPTPVAVSGITNAVGITAGAAHACALLSDATVRCWGDNDDYELGDGTTMERDTPVAPKELSNVAEVEAGSLHTCALLKTGIAECWGASAEGQTGVEFASPAVPNPVEGL